MQWSAGKSGRPSAAQYIIMLARHGPNKNLL